MTLASLTALLPKTAAIRRFANTEGREKADREADRMPATLREERAITFNPEAYPLDMIIAKMLLQSGDPSQLGLIHELAEIGTGSCRGRPTVINKRYRNRGISVGDMADEFRFMCGRFVEDVVAPALNCSDGLVYQADPVLRCHIPGDAPLGAPHRDESYGRQPWEVNVWLPITPVMASNSLWVESSPGKEDWHPFESEAFGKAFLFWGSQCTHFTLPNETGRTRVSLDIRVVPRSLFVDHYVSPLSKSGSANHFLGGSYTDLDTERLWRHEQQRQSPSGVSVDGDRG